MNMPGSLYWQEHGDPHYAYWCTVAEVAFVEGRQLVAPGSGGGVGDVSEEQWALLDNELPVDSRGMSGVNTTVGRDQVQDLENPRISSIPMTSTVSKSSDASPKITKREPVLQQSGEGGTSFKGPESNESLLKFVLNKGTIGKMAAPIVSVTASMMPVNCQHQVLQQPPRPSPIQIEQLASANSLFTTPLAAVGPTIKLDTDQLTQSLIIAPKPERTLAHGPASVRSPSTTPAPSVSSNTAMHNAKEKKDNGADFMKTKVKYFDRWLSRMKRPAFPKPPKGKDGKDTISRFKLRSDAIKALTSEDDKTLIAFVDVQEKARKAAEAEQAGVANTAINDYDEDGMLVMKHGHAPENTGFVPLPSKNRNCEEDGDGVSETGGLETTRRVKQNRAGDTVIDYGQIVAPIYWPFQQEKRKFNGEEEEEEEANDIGESQVAPPAKRSRIDNSGTGQMQTSRDSGSRVEHHNSSS
jgi:hypothetical protein